jgi:hypothetical protein
MSQFSWETETGTLDQAQPAPQPELVKPFDFETAFEPEPVRAFEPVPEPTVQPVSQPAADPAALAVSVDDFSALEDRILRAVNLVKRERLARAEAEDRANRAEALAAQQTPRIELLQNEVNTLRAERDHVRQRVERLLAQLDALEL